MSLTKEGMCFTKNIKIKYKLFTKKHHLSYSCFGERQVEVDQIVSGCGEGFIIVLTSIRFKQIYVTNFELYNVICIYFQERLMKCYIEWFGCISSSFASFKVRIVWLFPSFKFYDIWLVFLKGSLYLSKTMKFISYFWKKTNLIKTVQFLSLIDINYMILRSTLVLPDADMICSVNLYRIKTTDQLAGMLSELGHFCIKW